MEKLYVVEELDPFLEEAIRLMGIKIDGGKDLNSLLGELDPGSVARVARRRPASRASNTDLLADTVARPWPTCPAGRPPSARAARIAASSPCSRSCGCS